MFYLVFFYIIFFKQFNKYFILENRYKIKVMSSLSSLERIIQLKGYSCNDWKNILNFTSSNKNEVKIIF